MLIKLGELTGKLRIHVISKQKDTKTKKIEGGNNLWFIKNQEKTLIKIQMRLKD